MSAAAQRRMVPWTRLVGVVMMLAATAALWGAVRLARVQADYAHVKHGRLAERSADQVEPVADDLWRRYPANYYLALHMATGWWTRYTEQDGEPDAESLAAARRWVRRGLMSHPMLSDLHLLEARILAIEYPRAAAIAWDAYVDCHYWNAFNQAMRVDFHAQAGAFTTASEVLALLRHRRYHAWASAQFREAWRASMSLPPTLP